MGRFINADAFASTGQGLLGNNMFAYCNNNPIVFEDASGCALKPCTTFINDGAKTEPELLDDEEDALIEEDPVYSGTVSLGISGSIGVGPWMWGVQGFITIDANGYSAVQYGVYGGMSGSANATKFSGSIMPIIMVTNAPGYEALEDKGIQIGGSYGGWSLDYVGMLDESGQEILYHGVSIGCGASVPDVHVSWGNTYTLFATEFDWDLFYQVTNY